MVADRATNGASNKVAEMDYPAHERNYAGFIKMFKWATVAVAIIGAVVLLIIAN